MPVRLAVALFLTLGIACPLSAQTDPPVGMSDAHLLVLGGVTAARVRAARTTSAESPHLAAGLTGGAARNGWGVLALGMGGRGGEYDSVLLGGAASRRVVRGPTWSLLVFAGYGVYSERGLTGIERDSHGVLFGTTARWRVGPVSLAGVFSHMTGSYDEADVAAPFRFHVPRVSLGIGF